jgi:hypothetical protein
MRPLGGGKGTRTPGLRDANAPLSHLSYTPRRSPVFIAHGGHRGTSERPFADSSLHDARQRQNATKARAAPIPVSIP